MTFTHQGSGRPDASKRELEPWGVVNRRGHWYVAGHDRGREAPRVFQMSRITGQVKLSGPPGSVKVPDGTDVSEMVKDWDRTPPRDRTAVLRIRDGSRGPAPPVGARRRRRDRRRARLGPGHPQLRRLGWYADYLASFGPDLAVLDPPDLREAVIRRLKGALA